MLLDFGIFFPEKLDGFDICIHYPFEANGIIALRTQPRFKTGNLPVGKFVKPVKL